MSLCIAQAVDALGRSFLLRTFFFFFSSAETPWRSVCSVGSLAFPIPGYSCCCFLNQQFWKLSQTKKCCRLKVCVCVWLYIGISTLVFPSSDTHICNWIFCVCSSSEYKHLWIAWFLSSLSVTVSTNISCKNSYVVYICTFDEYRAVQWAWVNWEFNIFQSITSMMVWTIVPRIQYMQILQFVLVTLGFEHSAKTRPCIHRTFRLYQKISCMKECNWDWLGQDTRTICFYWNCLPQNPTRSHMLVSLS